MLKNYSFFSNFKINKVYLYATNQKTKLILKFSIMKKIITNGFLALFFIVIAISCNKTKVTSGFDTAPKEDTALLEAKNAVIGLNEVFAIAFNKGDAAAMANCYATDAKFMLPNEKSIEGNENIKTHFVQMLAAGVPTFSLKTLGTWGDAENMSSEVEWMMVDKDGKIVDNGKSIQLLKKENGKWKIYRAIHNSDNPSGKL